MQRNNASDPKFLAEGILKRHGLGQVYQVQNFRDGIIIQENEENAPSFAQRQLLSEGFAQSDLKKIMEIEKTDAGYSCRLLPQQENKKIMTPEEFKWADLPRNLQTYREHASASHVTLTDEADLDTFPTEYQCPILLGLPEIPVKITGIKGIDEKMEKQCFDLGSLLDIKQEGGMRRHPLLQDIEFSIENITPAPDELKKINQQVEAANKKQALVFPSDAKFDDKTHPAIFTFSSEQEAKTVLDRMIKTNPHLESNLSKVEIKNNSICFTGKNCESGYVKILLDSFTFKDEQTKKAANYLAQRTQNTKEHYSDNRFKNMLPGVISRKNKCESAFKTLQKSFEPGKKLVHAEKNKNIPDSPKRTFK